MSSQLFSTLGLDPAILPRPVAFRDDKLHAEEAAGNVVFSVHRNDGTPESYEMLTGLKNVFQKQLPKMPKEYITRLVYDRRHQSLAIVKPGNKVVGGITYRSFPDRHFAEIVFCAIASTEQVKGYGSYLMSHFKHHVRSDPGPIEHFLTYADNYAVGYFRKQGFTARITLDKAAWAGVIKDYDGGTLMQCSLVPGIDYLNWYRVVYEQQRELVRRLHERTGCGRVFPGLSSFPADPMLIPGVREAGWTPAMGRQASLTSSRPRLYEVLRPLLSELQAHAASWPFRQPVNTDDVPDYLTVVTHPIDLSTMESRLEANRYQTMAEFTADFRQIIANCRAYNDADTTYCKNAAILERFFADKLASRDIK